MPGKKNYYRSTHSYDYWISFEESRVAEITAGYNLLKATGREDLIEIERDLASNLMKLIETEWKKYGR